MKSDPYGYHMETRPDNATKYYELGNYKWTDAKWEKAKREKAQYDRPVNIYEVHAGSWKQYDDGNFYSYRKMAALTLSHKRTKLGHMQRCRWT